MAEKSFKSRIIHKHDIAENWEKATSFIPQQGEIIVYDIDENYDYERMKIGDGVTNVNELPFTDDGFISYNEQTLTDEQKAQARKNIEAIAETDMCIVPIENIADYGGEHTLTIGENFVETWGGYVASRNINFSSSFRDSSEHIFAAELPEGCGVQHVAFKFLNADGTSRTIYMNAGIRHALYYVVHVAPTSRSVIIFELLSNTKVLMIYDENGNYVEQEMTTNIDSSNLVNKLNSLLSSSSYEPSADYDVTTKKYVDNALALKADQTALDEVSTLVGDTPVFDQISEALLNNQADWEQTDETAADYIKNRTHYEIPEIWAEVELLDDTWNTRVTCKLASTPIEWAENNSYKIRIDNTIYTFEGMKIKSFAANAFYGDVYYIGADYIPLNTNMDFSEYPFCLLTTDFTNIYVVFEDGTINHTIEFFESEATIHYLDPKFIKDMYYDNGTTVTELVPSQTVSGFALMNDPIYAVEDPFELTLIKDNTYIVNWDGTEYELKCEILDGMPAVGNLEFFNDNFDGIPFLVAGNGEFSTIGTTSTAESHTISIAEIYHDLKQIDIKYLPIMEEAYETVFEGNGIISGNRYSASFDKCIIGMAKVTIDNVSEKVEFVETDGYESWLETENWLIATWREGIYFEFPDEEKHSVKIEIIKQIVKKEHLPDSAKITPNWNQNDETAADYIKNRTHYEIDNSISLSIVDSTGHAQGYTPYKVGPYTWDYDKPLTIQVDGVTYSFDKFTNAGYSSAFGGIVYRVGAPYAMGSITDSSEYPFTLNVLLNTEEYAHIAFADGSNNHAVKIPNIELKQLNSKYVGTDWNQNDPNGVGYINNRTHWEDEPLTISWDTENREQPELDRITYPLYLVETDETKLETIKNCTWAKCGWNNGEEANLVLNKYNSDDYIMFSISKREEIVSFWDVQALLTLKDNVSISYQANTSPKIYPTKGLYLQWDTGYNEFISPFVCDIIHKLDPKFIPWPDEDDALELVAELGVVDPVAAADGSIYTDKNGLIFSL